MLGFSYNFAHQNTMLTPVFKSPLFQRISHLKKFNFQSANQIQILRKSDQYVEISKTFPQYKNIPSQKHCRRFSNGHFGKEDDKDVPEMERHIHKSEVERFITECMVKVGAEEFRAKMLAANLTEADYVGHFSHGLNRLNVYVKDCQGNFCKPNNDPIILKKSSGTAWIDGNNGLGVVVGTFCMNQAIEIAKENGIGWVVAKGSNHFGICQW